MKTYALNLLLLFAVSWLAAQSEEAEIRQTLSYYIDGTSYNKVDLIQQAFYADAELFLDGKDGSLFVVPSKEYASWFEKGERGKFNGRIGSILSVDHFGNIAMAKVEILIPKIQKRFVDMFILKKIEGSWKIISKTANSKGSNENGNPILFVLSNARFYGDTDLPTGNSFSEIVEAYHIYQEAGYNVDFVSPEGGSVPLAYINTSDDKQLAYLYDPDLMYALKNTKSPDQVQAKDYQVIYYVGGGSAMFGVPENQQIQNLAVDIYEQQNGIVSAVCHGTAGIVNLKTSDGNYLYAGQTVNGYPEAYEATDRPYFKEFPFLIQKTIEERGGIFKLAARGTPHLESNDRLVTGQNHLSAAMVAKEVVAKLKLAAVK